MPQRLAASVKFLSRQRARKYRTWLICTEIAPCAEQSMPSGSYRHPGGATSEIDCNQLWGQDRGEAGFLPDAGMNWALKSVQGEPSSTADRPVGAGPLVPAVLTLVGALSGIRSLVRRQNNQRFSDRRRIAPTADA